MNGFAEFNVHGSNRKLFVRPDAVGYFVEENEYVVLSMHDRTVNVQEDLGEVCSRLEEAGREVSPWTVEAGGD